MSVVIRLRIYFSLQFCLFLGLCFQNDGAELRHLVVPGRALPDDLAVAAVVIVVDGDVQADDSGEIPVPVIKSPEVQPELGRVMP